MPGVPLASVCQLLWTGYRPCTIHQDQAAGRHPPGMEGSAMARMIASCRAHSRFSASTSADRCLGRSPPAQGGEGASSRRGSRKGRQGVARGSSRWQARGRASLTTRQGGLGQHASRREGAHPGQGRHSRVRRRLRACSSSRSAASCSASSARRRKARCARPRPPLRQAAGRHLPLGSGPGWEARVDACWALASELSRQGSQLWSRLASMSLQPPWRPCQQPCTLSVSGAPGSTPHLPRPPLFLLHSSSS